MLAKRFFCDTIVILKNQRRDTMFDWDVILDALIDSLKILAVLVVFNIIIALIEPKVSKNVKMRGRLAPLIGVSLALIPQCGLSVVATDLYKKRHITVGALIGVYLATSDEALPIFISNPSRALDVLPLIALKFALGLIFGYLIDFICTKNRHTVDHHLSHCDDKYQIRLTHCEGAELVKQEQTVEQVEGVKIITEAPEIHDHEHFDPSHPYCLHDTHDVCHCEECESSECPHIHKDAPEKMDVEEKPAKTTLEKWQQFCFKPILHSLEIFAYVLVVNIIFGIIVYYVGEDRFVEFLSSNKYVAPLFAVLVGAIPNCVSSVVISELYIMGGLGFGAALGGLCMNAGLGFLILFKDRNKAHIKGNLLILLTMFVISVAVAYIFSLAFNFSTLNLI